MRNRKSTEIIAALSASAALGVIVLSSCESVPRIDRKLHSAIGKALAREALSLSGQGGQITVIARDTEAFRQPAMDVLLESFRREIRRAGVAIAATHLIELDPLRPVEVPPGDFFELIRRSPRERVIVSFLGPPLLLEEQRIQLGRVQPKIVAFCSGSLVENMDLRRFFDAGLLHAAVVRRRDAGVAADKPTKGAFEQLYQTVRSAALAASPAPSGAARPPGNQ